MSPLEARQYLGSLSRLGWRFGLERMERMLEALGHPERGYRVLHVAGTNGKGSTCAFAAEILRQAGARVGLYTSPHLVRLNERIQIDGAEITEEALAEGVVALLEALPRAGLGEEPLTFFEFTTALALRHFQRAGVEVAVLETGLGGRLDATNTVPARVCAITRIGLDHMAILGGTLEAIAGEKAGIFKPGATAVIGRQTPSVLSVLAGRAAAAGIEARVAGRDFALEGERSLSFRSGASSIPGLELSLHGPHQRENAEIAVEAARRVLERVGEEHVREGLRRTRWPGRLETVSTAPLTLLDGAHNPNGAQALAAAMRALHPGASVNLVFGALADKDVRGVAGELFPLARRLYLARPDNERAMEVEQLAALASELAAPASAFRSVAEALAAARADAARGGDQIVLVAGSLYVVGEAKKALAGQPLP